MRPTQYTITARHVHTRASAVLEKHLQLKDTRPKCRLHVLWLVLFYAASRITSIAAACAELRGAPSNTGLTKALHSTLPEFDKLQRKMNRALQGDLPTPLRKKRQPLAIDLTLVPYHGEPYEDEAEIYRGEAKQGTTHFHAYATAYVVRKGQRYTVALVAVRKGDKMADVIKRLLREAAKCGIRPQYLLLDRGFCSVEVIRYLQAARYAYLMPLVLRGRKPTHEKGPSGSQVFTLRKRSGWAIHTMKNAAGTKANFEVCIKCENKAGKRKKHGRKVLLYVVGGMLLSRSPECLRQTYRTRFGIETSYRQLNQVRIRTCTRNPLLRFFYVGVALVLRNVWVWFHWEVLAERRRGPRRLRLEKLRLRQMMVWLQHYAERLLGIDEHIDAQRPAFQ